MGLTFIDFFAGIGGFRRGMELAGHRCVGFCEYDKFATAGYTIMHLATEEQRKRIEAIPAPAKKNGGRNLNARQKEIAKEDYRNGEWYESDVRAVDTGKMPRADCWCFGFPCTDCSVAGLCLGFKGHQSSLFFAVTKLIRELPEESRPRYLLIENVRNLLSVNRGFDFARVLIELDEIGYDAEWDIINSKDFVPQNRERIFIFLHLFLYTKTWILDDGDYYFAIGDSAHDALNNILAAKGNRVSDGMDYDGDPDKVYSWKNKDFRTFETTEFSEEGFTTVDGQYHSTTDTKVSNLLEAGDLNTWMEDGVTYLSRSDWENTWPESYAELTANDEMKKHLLAQVYEAGDADTDSIITGADTDYQISMMMGKDYDDEDWNLILNQLSYHDMMSLVGKNFSATDLLTSIAYPGTIDNDGPSGVVTNYSAEYNTGETIYEDIANYSDINPRMYHSEEVQRYLATVSIHSKYESWGNRRI